jgi:4'-phosphopantetheinyl transferase
VHQKMFDTMTTHESWPTPPEHLNHWDTDVHVWLAELEQPEHCVQRLARMLSIDELQHMKRFHFERDRRHFLVARGVLRAILSVYVHMAPALMQFTYGPHGKPSLAASGEPGRIRFNVSHAHELALFAVTRDREIAVDIEYLHPLDDAEDIARRFFSAREQAILGKHFRPA